jgi:hypothetical protein
MSDNEAKIDLLVAVSGVVQLADGINATAPALIEAVQTTTTAFERFADSLKMWRIAENQRIRDEFSSN